MLQCRAVRRSHCGGVVNPVRVCVRQHSCRLATAKGRQMNTTAAHGSKLLQPLDDAASQGRCKTVLSIDGGGMRGLIPARVLQEVEDAIREVIWSCKDSAEFKKRYKLVLPPHVKTFKDIPIDLADYFDLVAGTSTGSIVAAYLATKGGCCDANIVQDKHYKAGIDEFLAYEGAKESGTEDLAESGTEDMAQQKNVQLVPGSARSAQALFVATRRQIFAWGPDFVMRLAQAMDACLSRVPLLGRVYSCWRDKILSFAWQLLWPKFWDKGIDEVLQRSFGGGAFAPAQASAGTSEDEAPAHDSRSRSRYDISLSDSATGRSGRPGGMCTSLLIPTFHIDYNRVVTFWHQHSDDNAARQCWGYSTLNRLRPPKEVLIPSEPKGPPVFSFLRQSFVLAGSPEGSDVARPLNVEDSGVPPPLNVEASSNVVHVWDVDFPLWSIVRASTAAPTFFPVASVASTGIGNPTRPIPALPGGSSDKSGHFSLLKGSFADGGLVANNPTLAAIAFLRKTLGADARQLAVLSLGCGTYIKKLDVPNCGGVIDWGGRMLDAMSAGIEASAAIAEQDFHEGARAAMEAGGSGNSSSSPNNRFLRVQVVGFAPRSTMDLHQPHVPQVPVSVKGEANYLALGVDDKSEEDQELAACLAAIDKVDDWKKLLTIGDKLATHYRADLRNWVKAYVLGL